MSSIWNDSRVVPFYATCMSALLFSLHTIYVRWSRSVAKTSTSPSDAVQGEDNDRCQEGSTCGTDRPRCGLSVLSFKLARLLCCVVLACLPIVRILRSSHDISGTPGATQSRVDLVQCAVYVRIICLPLNEVDVTSKFSYRDTRLF